jgi:mono/diheme cytochrome c family protein
MQAISAQELGKVIREGGPALRLSKDMPRLGNTLEDQEITDLVAYIRSFCPHSEEPSSAGSVAGFVLTPVPSVPP